MIFGDYYCCPAGVTDQQMLSKGASAWWRKDAGFCGRSGSCDNCNDSQDCVFFDQELDAFCCKNGYKVVTGPEPDATSTSATDEPNQLSPIASGSDISRDDEITTQHGQHHQQKEQQADSDPYPEVEET
jgi:hypothetical protein